jgi:hypothetical protein
MSTAAPTLGESASYLYELYDVGRIRPYTHAVLTVAYRPDLAEAELERVYLRHLPRWESYRLVRISHWDTRTGRWAGHRIIADRVTNPALLEVP